MNVVLAGSIFRGVSCRNCGKPIRLSASLLSRQDLIEPLGTNADLVTKVFPARCRRCHKEGLYTVADIAEFPQKLD
jgi:hypothetical protein